MKSICIFSHYFQENYFPIYVKIYIKELANYFDEILIVTNQREIKNRSEVENAHIRIYETNNEGYDLGMFYKGFQSLEIEKYNTIACVNDSNILFGKLDFLFKWASNQAVDYWGILDSNLKPGFSNLSENYHIQSYFLVFNKKSIAALPHFFNQINIKDIFQEKNSKILKQKVILKWEIGLSQYFKNQGLVSKTYVNDIEFRAKYRIEKPVNLTLKYYSELIDNGVPILKKRVIFSTNLEHLFAVKNDWKRLIRRYGSSDFEIPKMIRELKLLRRRHLLMKLKIKLKLN